MVTFIDDHRDEYGVESICGVLPIAPSTYYEREARRKNPELLPARAKRDAELRTQIDRVWHEQQEVYGVRKLWKQLKREGIETARCTVARLMRELGRRGVVNGKTFKTTVPDTSAHRPPDLVDRDFTASRPNELWVADFTYVATWSGFVYTAFVIDVFARRIIGWRVARSMRTELVLDALEQAIWSRCPPAGVIHHSDHGSQYLSIRYSERLTEIGVEPSTGSVGDSYDNALAETIIGLYKTEVIHHRGPWRNLEAVEYATLEWVDWFNNRRLLEPIGNVPPAECEMQYLQQQCESAVPA